MRIMSSFVPAMLALLLFAPGTALAVETLAVLPFENNAFTDAAKYQPLASGLAAMLIADLNKAGGEIKVIERARMDALLKEAALAQTANQDTQSAVRAGKVLGARNIAVGSFMVMGGEARIDVRIIRVETSEVVMAESVSGPTGKFLELERQLAGRIAASLKTALTPVPVSGDAGIEAALLFAQGVNAFDAGDRSGAEKLFARVASLSPSYKPQIESVLAGSSEARTAIASAAASLPPREVEADGESGLSAADAIRQAQRAAVERAAGVLVHSQTEVENFVVNKDRILTRSEGYVSRFDVLKQGRANGLYTARIRASVSMQKVRDDMSAMKILLEGLQRPKILVAVDDELTGLPEKNTRMAETELSSLLGAKGLELVSAEKVRAARRSEAVKAASGDVRAAQDLGRAAGAQYVVFGKTVVNDAGEAYAGSGMRSMQAALQLRIVNVQTGLELGSTVQNGASAHVSRLTGASLAIRQAADKAVNGYAAGVITAQFQDYLNNGVPIRLNVNGVRTSGQYQALAELVEQEPLTASVRREEWRQGGAAVLDVRYKGGSDELAGVLGKRKIEGATLEVRRVAQDVVEIDLR